jgi:hypothetical protein
VQRPQKGARLRLLAMPDDPDPVLVGATGEVLFVTELWRDEFQVVVRWDNGRHLNLICPPDRFEVIEEAVHG